MFEKRRDFQERLNQSREKHPAPTMTPGDDGESPTKPNLMFPNVDDDDDNTFSQVFPRTKSNPNLPVQAN